MIKIVALNGACVPHPLAHAVMGDFGGCREQESPEEVERVLERQTEEAELSVLILRCWTQTKQGESRTAMGRRQGRHCQSRRRYHSHACSALWDTEPSPTSSPSLVNSWKPTWRRQYWLGPKCLLGKGKFLFQWLTVAPLSPYLRCWLAAKCWGGRKIAMEEMLGMRESCSLEKAMVFLSPAPTSCSMYAYFFPMLPMSAFWPLCILFGTFWSYTACAQLR